MQIWWTIHDLQNQVTLNGSRVLKNARWNETIVIQLKQIQSIQFYMFLIQSNFFFFLSFYLFYFILMLIFDLMFKKKN